MNIHEKIEAAQESFQNAASYYGQYPTNPEAWRELCRTASTLKALVNCALRVA